MRERKGKTISDSLDDDKYEGVEKDKNMEDRRLVYNGALVAVFVAIVLSSAPLIIKIIVGVPAVFAAIYLVMSAARVKYRDSKTIYALPVSEKLREAAYNWSVDFFGAEMVCFLGLLIVTILKAGGITFLYDWMIWIEAIPTVGILLNLPFILIVGVIAICGYFVLKKIIKWIIKWRKKR